MKTKSLPGSAEITRKEGENLIAHWKEKGQRTYIMQKDKLVEVDVKHFESGAACVSIKYVPYSLWIDIKQEEILIEMKGANYE